MTKTLWTKDFIRITLATSLGAAGGIISGFALSFLVFDETGRPRHSWWRSNCCPAQCCRF